MSRGRARTQRGATLLEVMISMAIVMVGMLGLFKVLGASVSGSSTSQRFTQGQARAQQLMEIILSKPQSVLNCMVLTAPGGWSACETQCRNELVAAGNLNPAPDACLISSLKNPANPLKNTDQEFDRTQQKYALVVDANDELRSTFVKTKGTSNRVYDIQLTIGWNDDGTTSTVPPVQHRVTLRSAVLR